MATRYNPPHPGETLSKDVLPALGLSVTDASAQLGVTRDDHDDVIIEGDGGSHVNMMLIS